MVSVKLFSNTAFQRNQSFSNMFCNVLRHSQIWQGHERFQGSIALSIPVVKYVLWKIKNKAYQRKYNIGRNTECLCLCEVACALYNSILNSTEHCEAFSAKHTSCHSDKLVVQHFLVLLHITL